MPKAPTGDQQQRRQQELKPFQKGLQKHNKPKKNKCHKKPSLLSLISESGEPESLVSTGLLVWSQKFTDFSGLKMVDNFLVEFDPDPEIIIPDEDEALVSTDFCDFIFPILIGSPNNIPLNEQWTKKIPSLMKPGCYLICARTSAPNFWLKSDQIINVGIYQTEFQTKLTRLDANLLFFMHSACKTDTNLNISEFIDLIDDLDSVKGHFFPHRLSQNMAMVMAPKPFSVPVGRNQPKQPPRARTHLQMLVDQLFREPSEESLTLLNNSKYPGGEVKRILKRHSDLYQIYSEILLPEMGRLRETFVTEKPKDDRNFYSERFNFFLSQDSFAVILDQNCAFDRTQWKIIRDNVPEGKHRPFIRLIRSGAFVAIEGTPRYCNLRNDKHTFYTRSIFLCRLTMFPMLIIQEGVKCFDAYYNNDGLDFTYFDSVSIHDLIYVDWYQLQMDLKMDNKPRIYRGHLMLWDEMNDILPTLPFGQMKFDPEMAAKVNMLCMEKENLDDHHKFRPLIVFTMQQVLYTYFDPLKSRLEILWNVYMQIDESHINQEKIMDLISNPVYFYMKSFNCIYIWNQKSTDHPVHEERQCEITVSSVDVTDIDLAKVGWSHQMFEQYLTLYLGRMYPYQNSMKQWLLDETRRLKRQLMVRPTTLTEKLLYRNGFYEMKLEQWQKEQAKKPKKWFLNLKQPEIQSKQTKPNTDPKQQSKTPK